MPVLRYGAHSRYFAIPVVRKLNARYEKVEFHAELQQA